MESDPGHNIEPSEVIDSFPEARPAEQRGLGLSSLKNSLSLFSSNSRVAYPPNEGYTDEEYKELIMSDFNDTKRKRQQRPGSLLRHVTTPGDDDE